MVESFSGYGLWSLVIINSLIFIIFAFSFAKPRTSRDWRFVRAWKVLYKAQREHVLATTGLYAKMRHPQYAGFVIIMFGFLLQWPTLLTLVMFPILVWMYIRLARSEERDAKLEFGEVWDAYAQQTPAFIPKNLKIL